MILRRRLRRLLVVLGSVAVLWMLWTFPQKSSHIEGLRKINLQDACSGASWRSLEELSESELSQFIVDDNHGVLYCYVPKVSSTAWMKVLYVLSKGEPHPDIRSIPEDLVQSGDAFTFLNSYPMAEKKARLKNYTKMLFVRDPFARLISAYRDHFGESDQSYYTSYGLYMLQRYGNMPNPPEHAEEAFQAGIRPSFRHFIQFLIDPELDKNWQFDVNWKQMHRLCHPCSLQYDFIGHQENLQEDASLMLKILNVNNEITLPLLPHIPTRVDELWDWFMSVPLEDRRALYKIYELDFQLFGYKKPQFLLDKQK